MGKAKTFSLGRNAGNGRFTKVSTAKQRPGNHTVEQVPKKGHGDTKKK